MMSFESVEGKPARLFNLGPDGSPLPHCPGCLEPAVPLDLLEHQCDTRALTYLTSREVCPFCNEWITPPVEAGPTIEDAPVNLVANAPVTFNFLESFSHTPRSFSFLRSRLPHSRRGWVELVGIVGVIITALGFLATIFPSVPQAVMWRINKAVKSPLTVSPIDCAAHFVLKGERLRLKIHADEPATGLRFEWGSSAGNLINHKERNRESEVELDTDGLSVLSVPVEVVVHVTVVDEYGDSASRQERITIMPRGITNNPPVFKIPPRCDCSLQEVIAGESVSLYALAEDQDPNETLTYEWQSSSPSVQLIKTASDAGSTVILTTMGVSPRLTAVPIKVSLRVSDGNGGEVTGDISLIILPRQLANTLDSQSLTSSLTNHSPKLVSFVADKTTVQAGETITLWCYATDPDEDDLFYDWRTSAGDIQNKRETAILNTSGITTAKVIVVLTIFDRRGGKTSQQMPIDVKVAPAPVNSPSPSPLPTEVKDQ